MILCGVMTGTSADSIDTAFVEFSENSGKMEFKLLGFSETPFSTEIRQAIIDAMNNGLAIWEISQLNFALARLIADAVKQSAEINRIDLKNVAAVGVHGQTLWHQPKKRLFRGVETSSTYQLVNLPAIGAWLGIRVIGDFRSADVALGGQGAPLVPVFDYDFFSDPVKSRIMLNIGGIANVTYLKSGGNRNDVIAFDTGPGNVLIDISMKHFFGKEFDDDGGIARKGKVITEMLDSMMLLKHVRTEPPKSTGRELFNTMLLNRYIPADVLGEDIVATITHFSAHSIAYNINKYCTPCDEIIVSGGGSQNSFLLKILQELLPDIELKISDHVGLPSKAKEAIAFAYLAYLRLHDKPGNIPSVTGAQKEVALGSIY